MIVPVTSEVEWIPLLASARPWQWSLSRVLVVVPHPDDETLAIGGFLAALAQNEIPISLVAVTDGENAYAQNEGLAARRCQEQENALRRLGIGIKDVTRLGLPDREITSHEPDLIQALLPQISRDTHIFAPWPGDFHPDHEACGRAAQRAAYDAQVPLTFYFFWTWHRGTPSLLPMESLRVLALTDAQRNAKREALAEHRSQLEHDSGEPILPPNLLWPAKLPFEVFLPA